MSSTVFLALLPTPINVAEAKPVLGGDSDTQACIAGAIEGDKAVEQMKRSCFNK